MIKLEVVGETPMEFVSCLLNTVAILAGKQPIVAAKSQTEVADAPLAGETVQENVAQSETVNQADQPKQRRRRTAKTGGDMPDEKQTDLDKDLGDDKVEAAPQPTNADVKQALLDLLAAKGDDAPPAVLKEFGAAKLSELKSEQFAAVIAKCKEVAAAK